MADQRLITLYPGDASPKDIVLRDLPVADVAAGTTIYLRQGDASPKDVILRNPLEAPVGGAASIVSAGIPSSEVVGSPGLSVVTSAGTLKRWNGTAWVAAKLNRYEGTFTLATLKMWDGSAWVTIDADGV